MKFSSCLKRFFRYLLQSAGCSSLTLFIHSDMNLNKFRLQLISTILFIIVVAVDAYIFGSYFGKNKHIKYGIVYPYASFAAFSYLCHFLIESARWKYLFLPFDVFESYDMCRLVSLTTVHAVVILVMALCVYAGKKKFYKTN